MYVVFTPDKVRFNVPFVISVCSSKLDISNIKSLAEYVIDEPDIEEVKGKEQSVILTGVLNPILIR
jgi:hypothetical protein